MDILQIPFAKHIGIEKKETNILKLESTQYLQNHIETIHASAQFALAETQSGLFLQTQFPTLAGYVIALLRSATVKYKSLATKSIYAIAEIDKREKEIFLSNIQRRGKSTIKVKCIIKDNDDNSVMFGTFLWYVQKI